MSAGLDQVSRKLLARAWSAGAVPGDDPLTIDLDSTVCETYGMDKDGAPRHNYIGVLGYHPVFAIAAGAGDFTEDISLLRFRDQRVDIR